MSALNATTDSFMKLGFGQSYLREKKIQKYTTAMVTKLSPFETYIAIIKGYCAMLILFLPSAFKNGGWAMSTFLMFGSGMLSYVCAAMLVEAGLKMGIHSYSLVVERTFGSKGRLAIDIMIAAT